MRSQRISWLDALRALAMLWVMLGHCSHEIPSLFIWTSPIKIPLFFTISGYLFHPKPEQSFCQFLRSRAHRLLLPYVLLTLLSTGVMMAASILLFHQDAATVAAEHIADILSGQKLWFIPCLMWLEIIAFGIHRASEKIGRHSIAVQTTLTIVSAAVGWALMVAFGRIPWHPETALLMILFFQLGILLQHTSARWQALKWPAIIGLVVAYLLLCWIQALSGISGINVNLNRWPCLPVNVITCCAGICALFLLFSHCKFPKAVVFMGQNTLTFYAFHHIIQMGLTYLCRILIPTLPAPDNCLWMGMLIVCIACVLCGILSLFINRFFPVLAGRPTTK